MTAAYRAHEIEEVGRLAAELRTIMTAGRTLTALHRLELPFVDARLHAAGRTREELAEILAQAISRLEDPVFRAAAHDLFPLPYGEAGWTKLSARGRQAGSHFGVGYDSFRRGGDRPSRMDEVLRQVGASFLALLERGGADPGGPAATPVQAASEATPAHRPRSRRNRRLVVSAAALAMVVFLTAWLSAENGSPKPPVVGCAAEVGELDGAVAAQPDAPQVQSRLTTTFQAVAETAPVGCPSGPAYRWHSIVVQELVRDGRRDGALLVSPNGVDMYMNNAAWGSYHQIGGKSGNVAQSTAGVPVRRTIYADGHVEIEFSYGTVMVAEAHDAPYFWIPAVFVPWWRDNQALVGLPTSNPLSTFRQEFTRGVVGVTPDQVGAPTFTPAPDPWRDLPLLETIKEHILRQADDTSWFVTSDGRRQWIPDGTTWDCLGGEKRRVAPDLPGYVIATLPYGGQASCPD